MDYHDTIVAISSPRAPACRGVVRLSGPETPRVLSQFFSPDQNGAQSGDSADLQPLPAFPPRATYLTGKCCLRVPGSPLDKKVLPAGCLWWPDARSYTGQVSAELHVIGAVPVLDALVETAIAAGARLARPGEFTLRAVLAGKMDLIQAEAVLGVIEAQTPEQLDAALRQLSGNLSHPVRKLRDELVEILAHLEAGLDFVEEDIEFISTETLVARLESVDRHLQELAQQVESRSQRGRPPRVVLVGKPNAGKSSIYNALLQRAEAIVSDQAGTTRDTLAATLRMGDLTVELVDTAGLEELPGNTPRAIAQHHARRQFASADWLLLCVDASERTDEKWMQEQIRHLSAHAPVSVVMTKIDLVKDVRRIDWNSLPVHGQLHVSVHQPQSIARLRDHIRQSLAQLHRPTNAEILEQTLLRCRSEIAAAAEALQQALNAARCGLEQELIAADLRWTIDSLSGVIGEVHSEDILDSIFSRFCIGK